MRYLTVGFLMCLCLSATVARGDLIVNFSVDDGTTFGDSFEVRSGEALSIGIYLQQTLPDEVLMSEGLISWGLALTKSPTGLGTIANPRVSPDFDVELHHVTTVSGFEWEYAESASSGITGTSILLGSFVFNSSAQGTTLFNVTDRLPGTGFENTSWYSPTLTALDEDIFGANAVGSYQFSVTTAAVPEPSSLAGIGCALSILVLRRRRKTESRN